MLENSYQSNRKFLFVIILLIFSIFAAYYQVIGHDFVNYDDPKYVLENRHVLRGLSWEGFIWAFSSGYASNWHPLTWLSHMLDIELFGLNPGWHHLVNVLFHIFSTLLLFFVLQRMTAAFWESAFVAALFALHPLHVESVAWIAERKDVLSAFFWMLTMWFYVLYVEKPVLKRYLLVLFFFILGLLSKPMLVTFPFVLLLLDYWPLKRFDFASGYRIPFRLIWEKIPLFVLVILSSCVTFLVQKQSGAVVMMEKVSFGLRIANALVSYIKYMIKAVWPSHLAVFYPYPTTSLPLLEVGGSVLLIVLISISAIKNIKKRPYFSVGWFWYIGTLFPVIGFVQVGAQAMADRYTYIPLIGFFIALVWLFSEAMKKWRAERRAVSVFCGSLVIILILCTWVQTRYWKNSSTLFEHAVKVTTDNYLAHYNLGIAFGVAGRNEEAVFHLQETLKIRPHYYDAHRNLARLLFLKQDIDKSVDHYRQALQFNPNDAASHNELGIILGGQGRGEEAVFHFREAIRLEPDYAEAYVNLGVALNRMGRSDEALSAYDEALKLNPDDANAHLNLGVALAQMGELENAVFHFRETLRINPDDIDAKNNLKILSEVLEKSRYNR